MKKLLLSLFVVSVLFTSCIPVSENRQAQLQYEREQQTAKYQSEYARSVNKLEMAEGNFKTYRRVVFYNVRLGENVFCCEGYCHIQIDRDGDIEVVMKTGPDNYLRHYLGQKQDITYISEQLQPVSNNEFHYAIVWNPKLWVPSIFTKTVQ